MTRFSGMANVIASSFEADFPNSPLQVSALNWLANEDPAKLAVDTDSTTLLERYTAALFYFATQGDNWSIVLLGGEWSDRSDQTDWLTVNAVCSWIGNECNDQGFLTRMDLGTCLLSSFCLCSNSVRLLIKYVLLCAGNRSYFRALPLLRVWADTHRTRAAYKSGVS
jgi:hypothetical protein